MQRIVAILARSSVEMYLLMPNRSAIGTINRCAHKHVNVRQHTEAIRPGPSIPWSAVAASRSSHRPQLPDCFCQECLRFRGCTQSIQPSAKYPQRLSPLNGCFLTSARETLESAEERQSRPDPRSSV